MSTSSPYEQLIGVWKVYIAPAGTAEPSVASAPSGAWSLLGPTNEDQEIEHGGALEFFRDNDGTGPIKATRPEEDVIVRFTVVGLTQENYAKIISSAAAISTDVSPVNSKQMNLKRGLVPTEYALILRGESDSPYGNFPAHYYIPRMVQGSEPTQTRGKDQRPGLECEFYALEDRSQAAGEEMGLWRVQTS